MPALLFEPGKQRNVLKLTVSQEPDLASFGNQLCHLPQQSDLLSGGHPSSLTAMNAPGQRQRSLAVGSAHRQESGVESQFGGVDDQSHRQTTKGAKQRFRHGPIVVANGYPGIVQEASQTVDQTGYLPRQVPLLRNQRQMHLTAEVQTGREQSQVAHARNPFARQPLAYLGGHGMIESKVVPHRHHLGTGFVCQRYCTRCREQPSIPS